MSLCVDCKAAGIEAAGTRRVNGRDYCSSHARKYFPMGATLPPLNPQIAQIEKWVDESAQKEGGMPLIKGLNKQQIVEDYKSGMSYSEVARKHGCNSNTVFYHVKKAGLAGNVRPRAPRAAAPAAAPEPQAIVKSEAAPPAPIEARAAESPAPQAKGQARCRVAMFEVEGDATAVLSAVEAVKAALLNRG